VSTIRYPGEADDYWRMKDCLRRLGIAVDDSQDEAVTDRRPRWTVLAPGARAGRRPERGDHAAHAGLRGPASDATVVDGHISMQKRPNKDLVDALRALGATLDATNDGYLPTR
jgi:5-enolpyruvylshikimate-3-phosphate synthase